MRNLHLVLAPWTTLVAMIGACGADENFGIDAVPSVDAPAPPDAGAPDAAGPDAVPSCTPAVLYGQGLSMEDGGWTVVVDGASTADFGGDSFEVNTAGGPGEGTAFVYLAAAAPTEGPFAIEFDVQVTQAQPHNQYDAAVALFAAIASEHPTIHDLAQMVFLDEDLVGWGDDAESEAVDTTTAHTYRLEVDGAENLTLSVDGVATLARPGFVRSSGIGVADQSNAPSTDGTFTMTRVERFCP